MSDRTVILGISAFYHDSAAALVCDGEIVAAAQEERFTRKKHDPGFPLHAIDYCLREAGVSPEELDYVGFYDKPLLEVRAAARDLPGLRAGGLRQLPAGACRSGCTQKLHLPREMRPGPQGHATRAATSSPSTTSRTPPAPSSRRRSRRPRSSRSTASASGPPPACGVGRGNRIELTHELRFPHSLGLLYSAFTYYTRLQGQLRRVQADGPGAVRRAEVRGPDPREADRPEGRRLVPAWT